MKKLAGISILCIVIDQIIKIIVSSQMIVNESIKIISDFFNITYVQNSGAAWSILSGNRIFLIGIAFFAILIIYFMFLKNKQLTKLETISYGILLGGIIGNLIDRIIFGYVIDYLDFNLFGYPFPIFNVADICIVISIFLIIILIIRGEKNEHSSK